MKRTVPFVVTALTILALVATLSGCTQQAHPGSAEETPSAFTWIQSTASDFKKGTLERIQVQRMGDGELTLAKAADGSHESSGVYTSPPYSPPSVFSAAVWQWNASVPDGTTLIVSIRTSANGKDWTDWQEAAPDDDLRSADTDWPGHVLVVTEARALQYRLQFASSDGTSTPVVTSFTWTFADVRPGPSVSEAMQMVVPQSAGPGVPRPAIIPRRGWGADENLMTWEPKYETPVKVIIHHTATPNDAKQDPAATVRAVYYYHAITRGWGDIGYNYLIDRMGNVYEGRKGGEAVVGGHDYGFNEGSVGISLIGDFQSAPPPQEMLDALVRLVAWICDRYQIDPVGRSIFRDLDLPNIAGHRETKSTTCPGDQGQARLPWLREQVADAIQQEAPSVRFISPEAGDVLSGTHVVRVQGGLATTDITLYLDGEPILRKLAASVEYEWNTTTATDGDHQLKAVAHNARGEEVTQAIIAVVDNSPPQATLLVSSGSEYATQSAITLTVEAFDVGSGLEAMQIVRGGNPSLAPVQPYQREVVAACADEPGLQTFSVQVADKAGLKSKVSSVQVFYDPNPPGDWSEPARSSTGEIGVRVWDRESGPDPASAFFTVSTDGGVTWSAWEDASVVPADSEAALFARVRGETTSVRFRIADKAGNVALSPVYPIPCEACPPQPTPAPSPDPRLAAPDLIVSSLEFFPPDPKPGEPVLFRTRVRNQGIGAASGFWVQMYLDPAESPYVNSIASQLGTGLMWYVNGLEPGQEITLISSEPYPAYGNYAGHLASGMHSVYVLVDAYHTEGTVGLILESDETNNLHGPVTVQTTGSRPFTWSTLEEWLSRWLNWRP